MNEQIKQQWLTALRSGDYEQGSEALVTEDNCYCCLGVLTKLYANACGVRFDGNHADTFEENERLPECVMNWADLTEAIPSLTLSDGFECNANLAELNDKGMSFADIADLIEEQL